MDDFLSQIKDNLDRRPAPDFNEANWKKLERQLDRNAAERSSAGEWWKIGGLLLLLLSLSANAILYHQLQDIERGIEQLGNQQSRPVVSTDTVYRTAFSYRADTVYKTQYVYYGDAGERQAQSQVLPTTIIGPAWYAMRRETMNQGRSALPADIDLHSYSLLNSPLAFSNPLHRLRSLQAASVQPELTGATSQEDISPVMPEMLTERLPMESPKPLSHPVEKEQMNPLPVGPYRPDVPWSAHFRPTGFRLGLSLGTTFPLGPRTGMENNYLLGLQGDIILPHQLSLWGAINYLNGQYATDLAEEVPPVDPPSDDFVFSNAQFRQGTLEYFAGLQYQLFPGRSWRADLGLGWGAVQGLPYEINYEFVHRTEPIELLLPTDAPRQELYSGFLLFRLGVAFPVSDHLQWTTAFRYRYYYGERDVAVPRQIGVQSGLQYKF